MITIRNVSLGFGGQSVFEDASVHIGAGDRFALIGPNGSGKSSLFRMILGEVEPDDGDVQVRKRARIGYLPQENAPVSGRPVLTESLQGLNADDGRVVARAKAILMGLGFKIPDFSKPVRELSGGWAMRVAMARLLLADPDILLLDEPTNHLDLYSLLWFKDYLTEFPGTIVLISHDRSFINAICGAVISIQERELKLYRGDYEHYVKEREAEKARLESAHTVQKKQIEKMQQFVDRNRARLSTARRAQNMMKRLDKVERIELPEETKQLSIQLPQPARGGKEALFLKGVHKSYGRTNVYRGLDLTILRGMRMAFVGPNGAGKSTLLKILAGVLPFETGERKLGYNMTVGYHSQHRVETLNSDRTVLQEAMSNARNNTELFVRTVLGSFLFSGDAAFKKVKVLSGGEKSRLSLVKILLDPPNLLLLDEPTTHLDMDSVEALIGALKDFQGTMAFISHNEYFINTLADHVVYIRGGKVTLYPGNFELFQWRQKKKEAGR